MKNEYIILNKTAIQKRIKWLEQRELNKWQQDELRNLRLLLSQSTPLIPEIEKALKEHIPLCDEYTLEQAIKAEEDYIKWYISNLKLDI